MNRKYPAKKFLSTLGLLVILLFGFMATNTLVHAQEFKFESLTTDNGLSQNLVYAIFQDSRHFLWIGTAEGLNRYDGNGFKVFKSSPENLASIRGHHFSSIVEDKEGNLWIGSYGEGLNKYIRKTESFVSIKSDLKNPNTPIGNRITSLIIDKNNHLWIGTESGLSRLDLKTGRCRNFHADINNQDSLCHERVYTLTEDSEGKIWVGTLAGVSVFDPLKNKFSNYLQKEKDPKLIYNDYIHKIYEDKRKNIWVGTSQGLYLFNRKNNTFKKFKSDPRSPNSINDDTIQDIIEDSHGNLWIATFYGGLILYDRDKNIFHQYKHNPFDPTSLSSNVVQCLFEDQSGILWVGTLDGGLCKLDFRKAQFKNYKAEPDSPSSISNNHVSSILVESPNSIWVGTLGGGINNLVRNKVEQKFVRVINKELELTSISSNLIYSIYADKENNLWFGTESGLAVFNKRSKTLKKYNSHTNPSMINNVVFKVLEDHSGKLWIGTYGGGISYLDKKTDRFVSYTHDPKNSRSIVTNIVRNIFEDSRGRMWVCTENGLDYFDRAKNEFIHFQNDPKDFNTIIDNKVLLVFESSKKEIWVGTPFGLSKIINDNGDPGKIKFLRITKENGLIGSSVQGIQEDGEGNLWISTNEGISKYDPATNKFSNFNISDGLLTNEFYVTTAAKIDQTGELIFGGNKGLVVFDPKNIRSDEFIPPVAITNLYISNIPVPINQKVGGNLILTRSVTETSSITLNPNQGELSLDVAALHFANPQGNKFKYQMEGLDSSWNDLGNRRFISFSNLEPGEYTLRVTAANSNGVWNKKGVSLKIVVEPPFYKTTIFRAFAVLVLMGLIFLVHQYRTRNIQKRSKELQEEVNKRTSEMTLTNKQLHDEVVERIKVEEKLRKAKEVAESANRSKSEFLANVSHELRTPLNAILGYAQIMRKQSEVSSKHKDQLLIIQQSGEHLLTLINEILDLRRIEMKREVINQEEINLATLIKGVVDSIKIKALEKDLKFEYNEANIFPEYIIGDSKKLKQILLNLLGNAVKYTDKGFVGLTIVSNDAGMSPTKRKIKFTVDDSGIGIPQEKYEEIFLPFKSNNNVKEHIDSVGLGLAISKRLIELLGGRLEFISKVGEGSTFSFELEFDVIQKSISHEREVESIIIGYAGERKNILIVDDNPTNRLMLAALLEPVGFIIQQTNSSQEALDLIDAFKPDLILLDLLMPGMNGNEFLNQYKNDLRFQQTKVIGVSAAVADEARILDFSKACDAFISKPVDTDRLLKLIGEQLNLTWERSNDNVYTPIPQNRSEELNKITTKPGKEILDEIISKVNIGDFTGVSKIIQTLSASGEFDHFCNTINKLAKDFNEEAIISFCSN